MAELRGLTRHAWPMLAAVALSGVGTGLTVPYLYVYLHSAQGMSNWVIGLLVGVMGAFAMAGNLAGGTLADRWGPKPVLLAGLAVAAAAAGGWVMATSSWQGLVVAALTGSSAGVIGPTQNALLSQAVPANSLSAALAVSFTSRYLGLGLGGMATLAVVDEATSLASLFLFNGLSYAGALLLVTRVAPRVSANRVNKARRSFAYREVLRDQRFLRLWLLTAAFATIGYGQLSITIPMVLIEHVGMAPGVLGGAFVVQTVTVLLAQLLVVRLLTGRRRTRAAMGLSVVWAVAWGTIATVAVAEHRVPGVPLVLVAAALFAIGETLISPSLPAIANRIAPPSLRGRYNGAFMLAYSTGTVAGPMIAGLVLARGWVLPMLVGLVIACGACAVLAFNLERHIPLEANRG